VHTEIKEFDTIPNNAPTVAVVTQIDTQANSFAITVQATDADNDKLIYKVYTGNTKDNITTLQYTSPEKETRRNRNSTTYNDKSEYRSILPCRCI